MADVTRIGTCHEPGQLQPLYQSTMDRRGISVSPLNISAISKTQPETLVDPDFKMGSYDTIVESVSPIEAHGFAGIKPPTPSTFAHVPSTLRLHIS